MKVDRSVDLDTMPVCGFSEIQRLIPHRFPFCLVDAVVKIEPGERIVAIKNVSGNEPYFDGHFPGQPIMPGVLMIESMAQSAVLLYSLSGLDKGRDQANGETESQTPDTKYLGMLEMRFMRPVLPGDRMMIDLRVVKILEAGLAVKGYIAVRGEAALKGEMLVMGKRGAPLPVS